MLSLIQMAEAPAGDGANIEEGGLTKRKLMGTVQTLGKAEGMGENARPYLFTQLVEASHGPGRVIGLEDIPHVFDVYSKAVAASMGIGFKPQSSAKQQESKLRVAVKLGELIHVNGPEIMNRTIELQKKQRKDFGKNDFSPFDGLVRVARAQLKSDASPLTDEQLEALLTKDVKDAPEEADRLEKIVKAITSLIDAKENPVSEGSREALTEAAAPIMTRIRELGGSTAMRKAAEKAERDRDAAEQEMSAMVERHRLAKAAIAHAAV
jgi:hypothetical protein